MKILVIFFDMLKPNLSNIFNQKKENINNKLDNFLVNFGGVSYVNTYTPACETYRSLACIQTGKLPKYSGVENRMDIYEGTEALKNILNEEKYSSYMIGDLSGIFSNAYNGFTDKLIPITEKTNDAASIINIIKKESKSQNECIFLGLEIAHQIRNDVIGKSAGKLIINYVGEFLNQFFNKIDKNQFDYIITFSDHGYRDKNVTSFLAIDDERSKVFLHVRKKGEKKLEIDSNLRCTCDIFTTIKNIIDSKKENRNIFGKDLFKTKGHEYIPIEDYKFWDYNGFFYKSFPNVWGIKEKDKFFITDIIKDIYLDNNLNNILISDNNKKIFYEILKNDTVYFKKFLSYYNISISIKKNDKRFKKYLNGKNKVSNVERLWSCLKALRILIFFKEIIKICLRGFRDRNEEYNYK